MPPRLLLSSGMRGPGELPVGGLNSSGALGDGTTTYRKTPVEASRTWQPAVRTPWRSRTTVRRGFCRVSCLLSSWLRSPHERPRIETFLSKAHAGLIAHTFLPARPRLQHRHSGPPIIGGLLPRFALALLYLGKVFLPLALPPFAKPGRHRHC
jgi:hypothetical protein